MVVTDEDGNHVTDLMQLPESTSIRNTGIAKLRDIGFHPISKWSDFSDYSFAEVQKR